MPQHGLCCKNLIGTFSDHCLHLLCLFCVGNFCLQLQSVWGLILGFHSTAVLTPGVPGLPNQQELTTREFLCSKEDLSGVLHRSRTDTVCIWATAFLGHPVAIQKKGETWCWCNSCTYLSVYLMSLSWPQDRGAERQAEDNPEFSSCTRNKDLSFRFLLSVFGAVLPLTCTAVHSSWQILPAKHVVIWSTHIVLLKKVFCFVFCFVQSSSYCLYSS